MFSINDILWKQLAYLYEYSKDVHHTGTDVASLTMAMIELVKIIREIEAD